MHRHIVHFHIPAFFIAVARICQPGLRDRPVVVAPPQSERALILSVSPEAQKEGVFKGMSLGKAMKLYPDLNILPPDPGLTERACQALAKIITRYTPLWEPSRPGHIYLDLTGTERLWGRAKDVSYRLKREIKERLYLSGKVGVAGNKMVSSIASKIMPSAAGVLDVDHGREASFLGPLKVSMLPGIGNSRRKILLEELSITRIRELAILDTGNMKLIFGRQACLIHQRASGIDPTPVYPAFKRPIVSEQITLAQDENDDQKLLSALYRLVEKCSHQMRITAYFPRKAGLLIRYSDQIETGRQINLPHLSFWDFDLYLPLEKMFLTACSRRVRVRFIKIWFWDFSPESSQLLLFHTPSPHKEKTSSVTRAMDRIRERYGEEVIQYGRTV